MRNKFITPSQNPGWCGRSRLKFASSIPSLDKICSSPESIGSGIATTLVVTDILDKQLKRAVPMVGNMHRVANWLAALGKAYDGHGRTQTCMPFHGPWDRFVAMMRPVRVDTFIHLFVTGWRT